MRLESLACPLHHVPELVWSRGHVDVLDAERAERVADGVDHRRARGDGARLADALDAKLVGRARRDRVVQAQWWNLSDRRKHVVDHGSGLELARALVVDDLFVE